MRTGLTKPDVAIGDFVDLRARQRSLESLAGFGGFQSTLFGDGEPLRVEGAVATADALAAAARPAGAGTTAAGRTTRGKARAPVVIVSHEFWRTQLGSDPQA